MTELASLVSSLLLFAVAALAPGPSNILIVETSVSKGRRDAVLIAIGVSIGTFLWASGSAAGVNALLLGSAVYPYLLAVGIIYLLKLAKDSIGNAFRHHAPSAVAFANTHAENGVGGVSDSFIRTLGKGLATSLSNPKSALFWVSIMSVALGSKEVSWMPLGVVGGCTALALIIYLGFAWAFQIPATRAIYARNIGKISGCFAVVYLFFAANLVKTLWST